MTKLLCEFSYLSSLLLCSSLYTLASSEKNFSIVFWLYYLFFMLLWTSTTWKWHASSWAGEKLTVAFLSQKSLFRYIVCEALSVVYNWKKFVTRPDIIVWACLTYLNNFLFCFPFIMHAYLYLTTNHLCMSL